MRKGKQKVLQAHIDQLQKEGDVMAQAMTRVIGWVDDFKWSSESDRQVAKSIRCELKKSLGSRETIHLK